MLPRFLISLLLVFPIFVQATPPVDVECGLVLKTPKALVPRQIDPEQSFESLVDWIFDELIQKRKAPGLVTGISGTDSVLVFLAAAKAFERAGRPDRVVGVHYAEDLAKLPDERKLEPSFWFQREVIPWLQQKAPGAQILVDSSINGKRDGLRWGALMDFSILQDYDTGVMRPPNERFWILGTRNATEDALRSYSNLSREVSAQVLTPFWKSEILKICAHLQVPQEAIQRSCESDCACGRDQLPAINIPEMDTLLMIRQGDLDPSYAEATIPPALRKQLEAYIEAQLRDTLHKIEPTPQPSKAGTPKTVQNTNGEVANLISSWKADGKDVKAISALLPQLLNADSGYVSQLFSVYDHDWLPEALILLKHQGLRLNQLELILEQIYGVKDLSVPELKRLALLSSRIGDYGFSFPQWRFVTQPLPNGFSMAEDFGFRRLRRSDDVRDALIPLSNPERDEYGSGLLLTHGNILIEYRRAYVLVSEYTEKGRQTLVIRNSSHFFGRDRLAEAAYVSFADWTQDDLLSFGKSRMRKHASVIPLRKLLKTDLEVTRSERLQAVARLLGHLDRLNYNLSDWLLDPELGLSHLIELVEKQSEKPDDKQAYVGVVQGSSPSWAPQDMRKMDQKLLEDLRTKSASAIFQSLKPGSRLVLISGPRGDFP